MIFFVIVAMVTSIGASPGLNKKSGAIAFAVLDSVAKAVCANTV